MQVRTVVSNAWRRMSPSRQRPCRFFEKVEWWGPNIPSRNDRTAIARFGAAQTGMSIDLGKVS